jgi:membrane protein DedA with SNARE-associated domain
MDFLDGAFAQHLVHCGYGAIFLIVMMESAGIPAPGETILVSAAVYAGTRTLDIRFVIAAAAAGAIVGDNIGFWVGRKFGEPLLDKWGHLIGLDARKRILGRFLFARYGGSIVFFGVSLRCCVPLPRCWRERTGSRPGASLSSTRPAELRGLRYSEPAVTCSAKA